MRLALRVAGNLLIGLSLLGLAVLAFSPAISTPAPDHATAADTPARDRATTVATPARDRATLADTPARNRATASDTPTRDRATAADTPAPERATASGMPAPDRATTADTSAAGLTAERRLRLPALLAARLRDLLGNALLLPAPTPERAQSADNLASAVNQPSSAARAENQLAQSPAATKARPPITRLVVPSIALDAEVVDAALVPEDGGYTWQVPAFKVGHAESTAAAGQPGNAVLLGHVTSLHSGNVFADLDQVRVGDDVLVFSAERQLDYRVVSTRAVPRADSSVLQPTPTPTVSLITCTGLWLPTIWDYTERLVVQAELAQ